MRRVAFAAFVLLGACSSGSSSDSSDAQHPPRGATDTVPESSEPESVPITEPWQVKTPASANAAARALGRAEQTVRDAAADADEEQQAAWEQQNAYRTLRVHPEWAPQVIAAVPADVRDAVASNVAAGDALAALATDAPPPTDLPPWTIAAPAPADELLGYYRESEGASGIPWAYLAAIHFVETRLGRIQGTSTAGAQGPMQFIQSTWDAYGEGDINNNRDAILAAGRYLDARGGPEDMDQALYGYNPSDDYVAAIQAYARVLLADERAYRGYHGWQVYYGTDNGVFLLPEGYPQRPAREIGG
ncbi:MAG: lytic transglycosylase domain-containing protein [Acidimicrobiia bacterium]